MKRVSICLLLGIFLFLDGPNARADEIKRALFVLGIHLGGAEGVAIEFIGDPPQEKPGALALIKRTVTDSLNVAEKLKLPTAGLKAVLVDVDRASFADMAKRLGDVRLEIEKTAGKSINPGAGAFFIMGVHQSGAERVALGASGFNRKDKPGTSALIERQLVRMADGTGTILVSLDPVLKLQDNLSKGAGFADLSTQLGNLRLKWQDELAAQPGFGVAVASGGSGTVLFTQAGTLTRADPLDRVRKDKHAKIHTVALRAGQTVIIDLESGDGTRGQGFFDPWLRVEDSAGTNLAENDDGGNNFNSRLQFQPTRDDTYRLIVTSYSNGETGAYTLTVRQK